MPTWCTPSESLHIFICKSLKHDLVCMENLQYSANMTKLIVLLFENLTSAINRIIALSTWEG